MVLKADTRSGGGGGEVSILVVVPGGGGEEGKGHWLGEEEVLGRYNRRWAVVERDLCSTSSSGSCSTSGVPQRFVLSFVSGVWNWLGADLS